MSFEEIGDMSQVYLCSAITGAGTAVTYSTASGEKVFFIKAKDATFSYGYNSRINELAQAKTRSTPDMKFTQKYLVGNGKFKASDANALSDWLNELYFLRKNYYLIVKIPSADGTWINKSFYDGSRNRIYYMKGRIQGDLKITQHKGHVWDISFVFVNITN